MADKTTTNAEACEELRDVCVCLNEAANALEELAELVMPNLPTGPRELFEVAETGLYERMRTCVTRVKRATESIEKA